MDSTLPSSPAAGCTRRAGPAPARHADRQAQQPGGHQREPGQLQQVKPLARQRGEHGDEYWAMPRATGSTWLRSPGREEPMSKPL